MKQRILSYLCSIFPKTATIDQIIREVNGERREVLYALGELKNVCLHSKNERLWGVRPDVMANPDAPIDSFSPKQSIFERPQNKKTATKTKRPYAHFVSGGIPGTGKR